jgi:hypothetical protein
MYYLLEGESSFDKGGVHNFCPPPITMARLSDISTLFRQHQKFFQVCSKLRTCRSNAREAHDHTHHFGALRSITADGFPFLFLQLLLQISDLVAGKVTVLSREFLVFGLYYRDPD